MSSGAHEEYLDCDTSVDTLFMYYLRERAFDLESMVEDYLAMWGLNWAIYDDDTVFMNRFKEIYRGMIYSSPSTTRLTEAEQTEILNYIKYEKTDNYDNSTEIDLTRIDYGRNLIRNGAIHWNLFLADSSDCDFQWLINGAIKLNNLTLVNFPCPYDDASFAIDRTAACDDYNTYVNGFVLEGDKKKKERVEFKRFLQKYNPPVGHDASKITIQNDFYTQLIADTIHSHNKNNVISRLASSKRWKRRVLYKLPPFRTLPSHD